MPSDQEILYVLQTLRRLSEREHSIINSFTRRSGFLTTNRKECANVVNKSRMYRMNRNSANLETLRSEAVQLSQKIRQAVSELLQYEKEEKMMMNSEKELAIREKTIFEDDIHNAVELEEQKVPVTVRKKVEQYILRLRKSFEDLKREMAIADLAESSIKNLFHNFSEQEQLYSREITIMESYASQTPEVMAHYEEELPEIVARLEVLTLREREEIINPLNALLKEKKDLETLFSKYFEGKEKITLEDIKEILRFITRTPEDVLRVQALLLKNAGIIDRTPIQKLGGKSCLDVISRYGLTSLYIAERKREDLKREAKLDSFTGLSSKSYFGEIASLKLLEASKTNTSLSLLVIDGDKFKQINDKYGHPAGDSVILFLAGTIRKTVKALDVVGRFGGDEFVVLFTNTNITQARIAAERIRKTIQETSQAFLERVKIPEQFITITGGLAGFVGVRAITLEDAKAKFEELFKKADTALKNGKAVLKNSIYVDEEILTA